MGNKYRGARHDKHNITTCKRGKEEASEGDLLLQLRPRNNNYHNNRHLFLSDMV